MPFNDQMMASLALLQLRQPSGPPNAVPAAPWPPRPATPFRAADSEPRGTARKRSPSAAPWCEALEPATVKQGQRLHMRPAQPVHTTVGAALASRVPPRQRASVSPIGTRAPLARFMPVTPMERRHTEPAPGARPAHTARPPLSPPPEGYRYARLFAPADIVAWQRDVARKRQAATMANQ